MSAPTPDELTEIRQLARINNFMPDIRALVERRVSLITSRVIMQIDQGDFNPDKAYSAWHEVHAYQKMLKTLNVKSKLAPATANKEI